MFESSWWLYNNQLNKSVMMELDCQTAMVREAFCKKREIVHQNQCLLGCAEPRITIPDVHFEDRERYCHSSK